MMTSIKQN